MSTTVCPHCDSETAVSQSIQEIESEMVGKFETTVYTCAACNESWVGADAQEKIVAKIMANPTPSERDQTWFDSLSPEEKAEIKALVALARRVMPDQTRYVEFFFGPCIHLGNQVPGEMINTVEGREELEDFFMVCLAMQCDECKGIGPMDHQATCSQRSQ